MILGGELHFLQIGGTCDDIDETDILVDGSLSKNVEQSSEGTKPLSNPSSPGITGKLHICTCIKILLSFLEVESEHDLQLFNSILLYIFLLPKVKSSVVAVCLSLGVYKHNTSPVPDLKTKQNTLTFSSLYV